MRRLLFGIFSLLPVLGAAQEGTQESGPAPASEPGQSYAGKVVTIEVGTRSLSDLRSFDRWEKILTKAEGDKASAVVLQIDSQAEDSERTIELIDRIAGLSVPTVAFVKGNALDVAAVVAVATQKIYVSEDALIGGAKLGISVADLETLDSRRQRESLLLAKVRSVGSKHGHNVELMQAMLTPVSKEERFGSVIVPKGTVLTLTGIEAASLVDGKPLLAAGIAESVEDVLKREGLADAEVVSGLPVSKAKAKPVSPDARLGVKREGDSEGGKEDIPGKIKEEPFTGKVVVIEIGEDDLINKQSFKFWRRMLRRAEDEGAAAVIFDLDTPGGLAFDTKEIMTEITRVKIPAFAYVNEDALSAGALVSVACDAIYMSPDSLIGAAGLVSGAGEIEEMMRKKLHSVFEAHVRTVAEKKGHDPELIRSMMIPDEKRDRIFGEVVVKKGELLTLTATEAVSLRDGEPLLAKAIVASVEEIAAMEGLGEAEIVRAVPTPFEQFAWWVAKYSFILILIGMGAAYAEMKAPGFGVGGAISLVAFGIFFFGNYVAGNLPGYEWVALFVLGILLILVEVFLIPGTGVTGIAGAFCVVVSLVFGMVDRIEWGDWRVGEFDGSVLDIIRGPILSLSLGLIGGCVLIVILMRFLPDVPVFRFLMVRKALAGGASLPDSASAGHEERVGWTGETMTDLRPAGKVRFGEEAMDVVTDGSFIPKGAKVRIVDVDGMRIVVSQIDAV